MFFDFLFVHSLLFFVFVFIYIFLFFDNYIITYDKNNKEIAKPSKQKKTVYQNNVLVILKDLWRVF